jgi:hypothetical protein
MPVLFDKAPHLEQVRCSVLFSLSSLISSCIEGIVCGTRARSAHCAGCLLCSLVANASIIADALQQEMTAPDNFTFLTTM